MYLDPDLAGGRFSLITFEEAKAVTLRAFDLGINYTLSLPIHCLALGATTVGQIENDVRIAQEFTPYTEAELSQLRDKARPLGGAQLEDWKRDMRTAEHRRRQPEYRDA